METDNVELTGGLLTGFGTLQAHSFRWVGGTMSSAPTPVLQTGTTEVLPGGTMTISGNQDVSLTKRVLLNRGTIEWGFPGDFAGHINVRNLGTIITDGGVFRAWNDLEIKNADDKAGDFVLQNNGVFKKPITEYLGTTTIGLMLRNNGGKVEADGSVNLAGGYSQTLSTSAFNLGGGTYTIAGATTSISGGLVTLGGGDVTATQINLAANFAGHGTIGSSMELMGTNKTLDLQGNLTISGTFYQQITNLTRVNGFTLTVGPTTTNDGSIQLGGGTLNRTIGVGGEIQNSGLISGPGTIGCSLLNRSGGNIYVGGGAAGVLNILGNFTQQAGATLRVELGGFGAGQFSRVAVSGTANLGGVLDATLINGFDLMQLGSFEALTFNASSGTFSNDFIDVGLGLVFDYGMTSLTLVTFE
jgi:hypothetical protein